MPFMGKVSAIREHTSAKALAPAREEGACHGDTAAVELELGAATEP
jgi:hypothetical protein